jgi:hypothetical protein
MSRKLAPPLLAVTLPAAATQDDEHGHDHAEAIVWDGEADRDCAIADPGTIVWELTEADADNIHGDLGEGAELLATYCPADTVPHTGGPLALLGLLGTALIGGGIAFRRLAA